MKLGQRIDRYPSSVGAVVGVAVGLGLGLWVAGMPPWPGGGLFALIVVVGLVVAASGQAVTVVNQPAMPDVDEPELDEDMVMDAAEHVAPDVSLPAEPDASVDAASDVFDALAMVDIPAGRFVMGSGDDDPMAKGNEKPAHEVALSGFACMVYPVTRGLYAQVMGQDPGWPEREDVDRLPVNNVLWHDAVRFCNQLSELRGLERCYEIHDDEAVRWNRNANGFRLPTEAEWEYACRAGTRTHWWFGDDESELTEYAWIDANSGVIDPETRESELQPHPVGVKPPNPWGLHDMHGNVLEWCWNWYAEYSQTNDKPAENPTGPDVGTGTKLLRGGSFSVRAGFTRCAFRGWVWPEDRFSDTGFRCVRGSARQPGALNP